ncbi:Alpha/Beta hydrolase fold [Trinorchestia longiramus]|nr:Alpha/Beta hydrolase fold [Trinorchestia longiramus]
MAGVEVDLNYHLRREFLDCEDPRHSAVYNTGHHSPGMLPASDCNSVEGAAVTASDRSFVSDIEGPSLDVASVTSQEKIKSFASIFRATEKPAIKSYIMTVIQSDHDYSHHWSCDPDNKSSRTQPAKVVKLFVSSDESKTNSWYNSSIQEHDDQDVDIEGDWSDGVPNVAYNEKLACKLMLECERHMEFAGGDAAAVAEKQAHSEDNGVLSDTEEEEEDAGDYDADSQKDLNLCKVGWTTRQERAFDRAVAILDGERLARLACAGVQHEPARRRALLDRSASKFRRLLSGECRWELSLCRWLHNTLLHTLSSSYLISYLDILQSLSYALPSLMDKLLSPSPKSAINKKVTGGSALSTPNTGTSGVAFSPGINPDGTAVNFDSSSGKFTPAPSSVNDEDGGMLPTGNATAPLSGSKQAGVSPCGPVDTGLASGLSVVHSDPAPALAFDAKNCGFGRSISSLGLNLLLKRPWDPAMPILHANKPQSLGSGSAVVLLVPHCPQLSPASAKRHKTFASTLHRVTTTVSVTVPPPAGGWLQEWLEAVVAAVVTAIQEWRARGRAVILAGWRAGGLLAAQIAAAHLSVEGVICLSPPFSDAVDYTPTASLAEHPASGQSVSGRASSVTTADILCTLKCPLLLIIGDRADNANVRAVEQLRERLSGGRSQLVVLQGADSELRLHSMQRYRAALTNSLVDRCIVDEIGCFISSMMVKEEAAVEPVSTACTIQEPATSLPAENLAVTAGMDACVTDFGTGELLVMTKRKACDEIPLLDAASVHVTTSPKKSRPETSVASDDRLLPLALPVVSMAVISSTSSLPLSAASVAASALPTASSAAHSKDVTEGLWSKPGSESSSSSARGSNRRGRRAGRGRGRGSRAPLPGQLIALGGGVGVAAQAHLKSAGRRQSVLSGRGGVARGMHSFIGRSPYASVSPSVSDSDVMLVSPVSSRAKMTPGRSVSIKEQVAQAAQSEAQLLAAVASITPQCPPESQAPSKITTVSTSNVVKSHIPMTSVTQAVEFLERSNAQQPQQVHYMLHPQQVLSSNSPAPIVVGSIGEFSAAPKAGSGDVVFTTSMMNITSGSLADKRKSIPSIMSNVGDRRKNLTASAGTSSSKKPIIFQTSGGGLFSTTNRIILPSTVSSVSPNISSLIVSSSPSVVPSLAPIKKLIRSSLAHSAQRMTAPFVLTNQKSIPSFIASPKPSVTFVNSSKTDSGQISGQASISDRKTLISSPIPGANFIANQKMSNTFVTNQKGSTLLPNQKVGVSPQPVPQIIGTLRGGRVSLNSDVVASGVLQGVPTIISGVRFISTRGALKGSMTRGGIVQAKTLATTSGRGAGATSRQLITVSGTASNHGDTVAASILASSASATKGHNILLTTLATNVSKPLPVSSPLTTDASTCTSPSPGTVLNIDTSKNLNSASKSLPQTPVGVKQLLLELPQGSEKTFKILPQKSQHVLKIADKPQQGHAKILVSSQKAPQFCYKPIVVQKKSLVSKVLTQGDHFIQLQPPLQSTSGEIPKQVTVSTTTTSTVRISKFADSLPSSVQTNPSLVLSPHATSSLECLGTTSVTSTIVPSRRILPITATVSLPASTDQSLPKITSIIPFVSAGEPLNDSPASLTEKLDLLAAAASELSQKMITSPSLESSEVLLDKANISDQFQHCGALTSPLSTLSNVSSLQSKDKDQLIEVSLEEVPKLDMTMSHSQLNSVSFVFKGNDANLNPLEELSLKTDSLQDGFSGDKADSATIVAKKSEDVPSSSITATTFSDCTFASESPNIDKAKQSLNVKTKSFIPVLPCVTESLDPSSKISQKNSANSPHQKKLLSLDTKEHPEIIKQDSESSSDVEIIGESASLQTPQANSKSIPKDKSKITLSKSSCSPIKKFSSSSNLPRLSVGSSIASPQIIVSTQSGKGTTVLRPGRSSLGTIDGKNITKLTVRPTSTSFKSISTQPSVMGAKKIIIASGLSVRHQNSSSTAISTSSQLPRKESGMVFVTASTESSALPAVMTVGASEAFSCMKSSPSASNHPKSASAASASLESVMATSEDSNNKMSSGIDKMSDVTQEPINTCEVKETASHHASTVQVVSTNEVFCSKANFLNLKKIHISKPCKLQGPIVPSVSSGRDESVQDVPTPSFLSPSANVSEVNIIEKSESNLLTESLHVPAESQEIQKLDDSVSKAVYKTINLSNASALSTSTKIKNISQAAVLTKVSLLDALTSSTVQEPRNPITSCTTQLSSEIQDEPLKMMDTSNTGDCNELESLNGDEHSSSLNQFPYLAEDKFSCASHPNTVSTSSSSVGVFGVSNMMCAEDEDDDRLVPSTSDSNGQTFDDQVMLKNSNFSATKSAEKEEAGAKSEILHDGDKEMHEITTSTSPVSTKRTPQASEEERTKNVKTPLIQGGAKLTKGASTRTKNISTKTQKRHSARLSLTPYEGAAQLRSGKKRST